MIRPIRSAHFAVVAALAIGTIGVLAQDTGIESNLPGAGFDTPAPQPTAPKASRPTPAESSAPTLQVYTRETIVDVTVIDANGKPIRGLKRTDFTINEDNHPQSIRGFSESGQQIAVATVADQSLSDESLDRTLLPDAHTNQQDATASAGPCNIIMIDALHSTFVQVARSMEAVDRFVDHMRPGTEVALFSLTIGGLHMMQGLTSNPALLHDALAQTITEVGTDQDLYNTNWITVDALDQVAAYVAPIRGRKNFLWLTPGMPAHLTRDGGYGWAGIDDMTIVHRLMDTYERFTAEQVAVSPVDPRGVGRLGRAQLAAEEVAEQSGGLAVYETNDLASGIANAVDRLSDYYTISYVPPRAKPDGHFHTITVTTNVPGAKLIYRSGYNSEDVKPLPQFTGVALLRAALEGRVPAATQVVFDASVSVAADQSALTHMPVPPKAKGKARTDPQRTLYDLNFDVPADQIAANDTPDGQRAIDLDFAVAEYDINGRFLGGNTQKVARTFSPEAYQRFTEAPLIFHLPIAFYSGPLFLRVGVLDHTSNKAGTIEVPVKVPKPVKPLAAAKFP